jgi:hypothetical protein
MSMACACGSRSADVQAVSKQEKAQPPDLASVMLVVEALHGAIPTTVGEALARGYDGDRCVMLRAEQRCELADRIRLGRQFGHGTGRAHVAMQARTGLCSLREEVERSASRSDAPTRRKRIREGF